MTRGKVCNVNVLSRSINLVLDFLVGDAGKRVSHFLSAATMMPNQEHPALILSSGLIRR